MISTPSSRSSAYSPSRYPSPAGIDAADLMPVSEAVAGKTPLFISAIWILGAKSDLNEQNPTSAQTAGQAGKKRFEHQLLTLDNAVAALKGEQVVFDPQTHPKGGFFDMHSPSPEGKIAKYGVIFTRDASLPDQICHLRVHDMEGMPVLEIGVDPVSASDSENASRATSLRASPARGHHRGSPIPMAKPHEMNDQKKDEFKRALHKAMSEMVKYFSDSDLAGMKRSDSKEGLLLPALPKFAPSEDETHLKDVLSSWLKCSKDAFIEMPDDAPLFVDAKGIPIAADRIAFHRSAHCRSIQPYPLRSDIDPEIDVTVHVPREVTVMRKQQ